MKKVLFTFLSLITIFLTSCASTKKVITEDWGPMAVVSITFNEVIEWEQKTESEKQGPGLLGLLTRKEIEKNGNEEQQAKLGYTTPLIEDAKNVLFDVLNELDLEIIDEVKVIQNSDYKDFEQKAMSFAFAAPKGYKAISYRNKLAPKLKTSLGAKTFAYISFDVKKTMQAGIARNGQLTGCIWVSIIITDEKGKLLANYNSRRKCFDSIPVVMGVYDTEKLQDLYPEVFEYAIRDALFN